MFYRNDILGFWKKCQIAPTRLAEADTIAGKIVTYRAIYDPVSEVTKVPWWVIGAIDYREESFNHLKYLGNGDPLGKKTTDVPRGRGPFKSWMEGAIDAVRFAELDIIGLNQHWDIVTALMKCESYNGHGYETRGIRSPYVWAGTNMQQPGMYTGDHHWDPKAEDSRFGCAALFKALRDFYHIDINEA